VNELLRRSLFLPPQASDFAVEADHLHYFVIITTMIASTMLGVAAVWFMARYRARRLEDRTPHIEAPLWLEALFVIVPLAFFLTWFRIGFVQYARLAAPPRDALDIYVMGKQWMWKFAYPNGPSGLALLRIPVNRPVRLLLTSRDVIHSLFIPAFRIKEDALPGRYTQTWFRATRTGRFPIFCTEYCGTEHSRMRAEVEVLDGNEFDRWLAREQASSPGLSDKRDTPVTPQVPDGFMVTAAAGCLKCHTTDGSKHLGPSFAGMYLSQETLAGGRQVLVDEAYITESMMHPERDRVAGFQQIMPSYLGKLDPAEAAAIVEFIRSLKDVPREP
jgi:cytochrome c oxidase subunit II